VNIEVKPQSEVAIVTGASRGLGRSTALNLAKKGVDVIVTYHANRAEADTVVAAIEAEGRKGVALQLDASNVASFDGFIGQVRSVLAGTFGREQFDFLVNNAGTAYFASFDQTTEEAFDTMVDIHLKGVFFLTQKLLPVIADGGRIVNLSSGLARFTNPGMSAYAVMKGGVEVLTRYLAKELGPRGIAVNTVAPGAIETDFGGGIVRDDPDVNHHIAAGTALGRVGLPEDIGPMIASLLSDDNRWVNGQRIEMSGGALL
jgi:NAD(P)-dependent dehydrogenase (short-subunit alcohol dehydrogenase family)